MTGVDETAPNDRSLNVSSLAANRALNTGRGYGRRGRRRRTLDPGWLAVELAPTA